MSQSLGILGLICLLGIAYAFSTHRQQVNKKLVIWGLGLQVAFALLVLGIPSIGWHGPLKAFFSWTNTFIINILTFTDEGSRFLFGPLIDPEKTKGFIFALQVLPTIIFVSSFVAIAYHFGLMQKIIRGIAILMQKTMGISGAESLSTAANIFVGQTEAPLVIRPYLAKMTRSELMATMTGGMATVAGGVMAAYVGLLKDRIPEIAGHLLTASIMSAPAALAIAKIMNPETEKPETLGGIPKESGSRYANAIEAAARGASEGLTLALNVAAMLLAFIALIAAFNAGLSLLGDWLNFASWGHDLTPKALLVDGRAELSLQLLFAWIFAPLAWLMGIPWAEAPLAGAFLGEKISINEFVAYLHLSQMASELSDRSVIILSYALCGFANFSSIAIQIGGIGTLAPERKGDLAKLGLRSVLGGSLAAFMTATIAGILI